ncbi:hypothetical protein B0H16DRAFT_1732281 [Mycena metata]|uniref:Uncharacterized protein n=1 Tax=Mycena metata TaxID=1033252 RepID=A0AAD7I282_9AGAR|nr:hypothetical protein B0H16DRAFT_1732281 [Mycena metata]
MPAPTWTTPAQFDLLSTHMPEYIAFFRDYPVDGMLGTDKATATPAEWQTLQTAILAKKEATNQKLSSLRNALFNGRVTRRRAHCATEIFQKRNRDLVMQELDKRGHDELNKEHMVVDGEELDAQEQRTKEARVERMRMRNVVVKELFAQAPQWEREEIEDAVRAEKESLSQVTEQFSLALLFLKQSGLAIDESSDVMETVLKTVREKTGWFSFAIWGGPNPRHDGELSLKCAVYGNTPAGNGFIAQHANYDEGILLPFQQFLHRCFLNGAVHPPVQPPADVTALDSLITMAAAAETPSPAEKPAAKAVKKTSKQANRKAPPKRMRKPKAAVPPPSTAALTATTAPPVTNVAPTRAVSMTTSGTTSGTPVTARSTPTPTAPETPRGSSFGDDSDLPNDDNTDIFGNDDGSDWMAPENLGAMQDIFNPPTATEPLASLPPSSSHLGSLTPLTLWPKGMTAPTSPMTAGRAAQAERGGSVAAATYVSAINPALLMQGTPPPPPRARGCFNGAAFAPNRPVGSEGEASSSKAALPILFDTYRKITATSPVRAFRDQEAYRREVAARPRADIFALSPTTRPVFTLPTDTTPGFFTSASSSAPTLLTPSSSSSTSSSSTTSPPATLPVSSMPAVLAAPSASVPAPAVTAPKPAVYNSRPMANPTKVAKAAVLGNTVAVVVGDAAKKRGRKSRALPDDITNAIADAPLASSAPIKARSSAPVGENVQLCTARPGGVREMVRLEKEAGKRAKEREAEQRCLASRMHNPDGNHDLVCVPAPRRSGRESKGKAPPRPDEGYTGKVVNSTRGELGRRQGPQGVEIVPRGKRGSAAAPARNAKVAKPKPRTKN